MQPTTMLRRTENLAFLFKKLISNGAEVSFWAKTEIGFNFIGIIYLLQNNKSIGLIPVVKELDVVST